jgi:rubrerythrin
MDFGIFKPDQGSLELENISDNILKVLRLGVSVEDKSIKFYGACQENVSSQDTKRELANIIAEEKKHKDLLLEQLKHLEPR